MDMGPIRHSTKTGCSQSACAALGEETKQLCGPFWNYCVVGVGGFCGRLWDVKVLGDIGIRGKSVFWRSSDGC